MKARCLSVITTFTQTFAAARAVPTGALIHRTQLFYLLVLIFLLPTPKAHAQLNSFPYAQSFEEAFETGTSVPFLPYWWGNEVAAGSRIYQTSASHSGSKALAAVPTSSFTPDIRLLLDTRSLPAATLSFWAGSAANGSGTRPAQLLLSYSADGGATFSAPVPVGTFPNATSAYQQYTFPLPTALINNEQAVVRWQVLRGEEGAGTAATVLLDDVAVLAATPQLQLLSAEVRSAQEILLTFSEAVDPASAAQISNYSLSPAASILSAEVLPTAPHQVLLRVNGLSAGEYTLRAQNIEAAGAADDLVAGTVTFRYTPMVGFREIVINEIFADPNPKGEVRPQPVQLPTDADAEFVELLNLSDQPWPLQNLRLSGGQPAEYTLAAGAYVLLVPAGKRGLYEQYGAVVEVQGWKSLSNSGTAVVLTDAQSGRTIDSVRYTAAWYGVPGKQDGGWSLEQINPLLQCSFPGNWQASSALLGATPAAPNSVLDITKDTEAPELLQAVAPDPEHIVLFFSEYIAPASIADATVALAPESSVASLRQQDNRIVLNLAAPLQEGLSYSIGIAGFADCSGNALTAEATVIQPRPAEAGEVVINELMYDPAPGRAEWIELYNTTSDYLNLADWYLGIRDGSLRGTTKLSEELLLLPPNGYLVLTGNAAALLEDFPQLAAQALLPVADMPSLRNSGDTLVLLTPSATLAESAVFSDALHHPLLHTTKGVSLERISPTHSGINPANWTSAAAPAFATPGMRNSQQYLLEPSQQVLTVAPEVLEPSPDGVADVILIHYQFIRPGLSGTLVIVDASGREVLRLADNRLLGQEGTFSWNGTNQQGERVRNGYYIVLLSVFAPDGYQEKYRETIVVSTWL